MLRDTNPYTKRMKDRKGKSCSEKGSNLSFTYQINGRARLRIHVMLSAAGQEIRSNIFFHPEMLNVTENKIFFRNKFHR